MTSPTYITEGSWYRRFLKNRAEKGKLSVPIDLPEPTIKLLRDTDDFTEAEVHQIAKRLKLRLKPGTKGALVICE